MINIINMKLLCFLLLFSFFYNIQVKAANDVKQPNIAGGNQDQILHIPYQAALERFSSLHPNYSTLFCGAAILSFHWLASANHCLLGIDDPKKNVVVRTGSSFLERHGTTHPIADFFPHPQFKKSNDPNIPSDNNLVLIQTATAIVYDKYTNSIPLIEPTFVPTMGQDLIISGWGIQAGKGPLADIIRSACVNIVSEFVCNTEYQTAGKIANFAITKSQFCASAEIAAVCGGDAGGPAVFNGKLAGIIASSNNTDDICRSSVLPTVFTKIAMFVDWIRSVTKM